MEKRQLLLLIPTALIVGLLILYFATTREGPPTETSGNCNYTVGIFSYVTHPVLDQVAEATKNRLKDLSLQDGCALTFTELNAGGDTGQLAELSTSLLKEGHDLLIPIATPTSRQLVSDADQQIPIIYSFVTNPSDLGEARFQKNVTGVSDAVNYPANIELIFDWVDKAKRIGFIYNPAEPNSVDALSKTRPLVEEAGAQLVVTEVQNSSEVAAAAERIVPDVDLFYVGGDNTVVGAARSLISTAQRYRKPVFASDSGTIAAGAVAGVSVDYEQVGAVTADLAWDTLSQQTPPKEIPPVTVKGDQILYNNESLTFYDLSVPTSYLGRSSPTN